MDWNNALLKRTFDVCLSGIALLVLWPVILLCVLIARIDTSASGLFSQRRVGLGGKEFNVRKIRSMKFLAHLESNTVTVQNDLRITKSGAFFRRLKLDELPQLWNVFLGEMSFVGPRPDVPGYADELLGDERKILAIRPGITGPATLKYRDEERLLASVQDPNLYNDEVIFPDKVRINLNYLNNWSFLADINYLLMTVGIKKVPKELESVNFQSENTQ